MSSFVSTGNCKLGHDCRRVCSETDDTTKLSPTSCEFVFTPSTPTRQNSFVASASAVCIGHKEYSEQNPCHMQGVYPLDTLCKPPPPTPNVDPIGPSPRTSNPFHVKFSEVYDIRKWEKDILISRKIILSSTKHCPWSLKNRTLWKK